MSSNENSSAAAAGRHDVPCWCPATTRSGAIAKVVRDFRAALPEATIFVYDNNSTDDTVAAATAAGAEVLPRGRPGQGLRGAADVHRHRSRHLRAGRRRRHLRCAERAHMIARLLDDRLDMVVGEPQSIRGQAAYRAGHRTGNLAADRLRRSHLRPQLQRHAVGLPGVLAALREIVSDAFGRLRNRNGIDRPCARTRNCRLAEIATPYYARPSGSASKLSTWRDGFRILWTILRLYRAEAAAALVRRVRRCARHHVDRLRHADFHHLPGDRAGAAAADRRPVDGPDAARVPVDRRRPDPRYGHAGPARDEADRLSRAARARRGAAAGLIYLCEHWPEAGIAAACPILAINLLSRFLPEASTAASKCGRRVVPNTAQLT